MSGRYLRLGFIALIISLLSCNSGKIYQKTHTFSNYSWNSAEKVNFAPEISKENAGNEYHLILNIRYLTGFMYKYLNLKLVFTRPDGGQSTKDISIQLITDDKKYRGDGMGDIWDFDYEISEPLSFPISGKYELEIKSLMGDQAINFINEIGITLNRKK